MQFETVSHATLLLTPKDQAAPLLATDPWLFGSCYWRSWWLSNPPSEETIRRIGQSRYIYLTHEHPDHFHVPTLRRLAPGPETHGPTILVPDFLHMQMDAFLREELGYRVERLDPDTWRDLGEGVRVMSLPYPNNDSVLLVDTPQALLIDLNDVKPSRGFLERIGAQVGRIDKPRIALRSYSLAGRLTVISSTVSVSPGWRRRTS
jgi:UDP-MurNAc hydroxylase